MVMIGRAAERARIDTLVDAVRTGQSGALAIHGEPGLGKTILLEYAATTSQLRMIDIAGVEVEMQMGYAALHRLLLPVMDLLAVLPGPQRTALESVFGLVDDQQPDRFLVGLAALSLLAAAARSAPIVCIIDDAQWVDQESLAVFAFVARRVLADRLLILFGVRDSVEHTELIPGVEALRLGGLSSDEAKELLDTIGADHLDHPTIDRLIAHTNGNPLALVELVGEFGATDLAEQALRPQPMALGPRIEARFLRQVRDLPRPTQRVLLLAAAEPSGELALLRQAMSNLDIGGSGAELDSVIQPAADLELVTVGRRFAFRHPLTRSAVYGGATPLQRRAAHRALADALDPSVDTDRWIWHLASATQGRDDEVADGLETSADRARQRSGFAAASSLLVRSAELTIDPQRRADRLLIAAADAMSASSPERASQLVELALPDIREAAALGTARLLQGRVMLRLTPRSAASVLLDAANILSPVDPAGAREALLDAVEARAVLAGPGTETDVAVGRAALAERARRVGPPTAAALLLDGFAVRVTSGHSNAVPILRQALVALTEDPFEPGDARWCNLATNTAVLLWDNRANIELTKRCADVARQNGNLLSLWTTLVARSACEARAGRLALAASLLDEARDITSAVGDFQAPFFINVQVLAWQGRTDDVKELAEMMFLVADMVGVGAFRTIALNAIAIGEIGHGRFRTGFDAAWPVFCEDSLSIGHQSIVEVIESGVRCGEHTAVAQAFARLDERASASGTSLALGLMARSRALLATDDAAEDLYMSAIDLLDGSEADIEVARTVLLLGEWLVSVGRRDDAEARLRDAVDRFVTMGALGFAQRCETALASIGRVVARRPDAVTPVLTSHEERVAALAANGLTNSQIASQLFVSVATIEFHLSKVYRKLGVSSRRQLPVALAADASVREAAPGS